MLPKIRKILTIFCLCISGFLSGQEIYTEHFTIPGKGVWAGDNGKIITDFTGVDSWLLNYQNVQLTDSNDYAKTVKTAGGRFECRDINGEVIWSSSEIDISDYKQINIQLTAYETGSGANEQNKYLNAFYKINGGDETLFSKNGVNKGNWGNNLVEQNALTGQTLQIIVRMNNHYSNDKVTLDEIIVTGENTDSRAPFITSVKSISATKIQVLFNEPVTAVSTDNFEIRDTLDNRITIDSVYVSEHQSNLVVVKISNAKSYLLRLTTKNISDFQGNKSTRQTFNFEFFPPVKTHDLVVNELMIDPSPAIALPEFEYIEIFNRQPFPINIENWTLKINEVPKTLDRAIIQGNDFLLICATKASEQLSVFARVLALPGFQGLRNSGAEIELIDNTQNKIDAVNYTSEWFLPAEKNKGGWSLERIDPDRFCNQRQNWLFSENLQGGTPGDTNSVFAKNPDLSFPTIKSIAAISKQQIEIQFSEPMDTTSLKNNQNYVLDDTYFPSEISFNSSNSVFLNFDFELELNKTYTLRISGLSDQCANLLPDENRIVQWNNIEPGDILLNEVLFNPVAGGNDFVEIYNHSVKTINLSRLLLASRNDSIQLTQICRVTDSPILLYPEQYLALTKDTNGVFPYFNIVCPECFLQMEKIPSFNNDNDYVVLLNEKIEIVDELNYSEKMHSPLLFNAEGVSLERVSAEIETNQKSNWFSASSESGYGTPGYKNSQTMADNIVEPKVSFEPDAFSPNNDGYNDKLKINIETEKPGYLANILIFDSAGQLMLQLKRNSILGSHNKIIWTGIDETGRLLQNGIYVVFLELFNTNGKIYRFKKGVILTNY